MSTLKKPLTVAGASLTALAAVAVVPAAANAVEATTAWEDGSSRFEQTVDDTTPAIGDHVTITTSFQRKWTDEYIYNVKEIVDGCFDYVDGSAAWEGKAGQKATTQTAAAGEEAFVRVEAPNKISWKVTGLGAGFGAKQKLTTTWLVSDRCVAGQSFTTTMHYGGSLGDGIYRDKGPTITPRPAGSTPPSGTDEPGASGSLDGGSLDGGSLAGAFGADR